MWIRWSYWGFPSPFPLWIISASPTVHMFTHQPPRWNIDGTECENFKCDSTQNTKIKTMNNKKKTENLCRKNERETAVRSQRKTNTYTHSHTNEFWIKWKRRKRTENGSDSAKTNKSFFSSTCVLCLSLLCVLDSV